MSDATTPRELLRHTLATLAYRLGKAVRGAPDSFAELRTGESTRTPARILAHIGDLMDWGLSMARGQQAWIESPPRPWNDEVRRVSTALGAFDAYLASNAPLGLSAERLFQGPIADALTHTGQLTLLRRLGGSPVRGENYAKAEIQAGRVGATDQAAPTREFD